VSSGDVVSTGLVTAGSLTLGGAIDSTMKLAEATVVIELGPRSNTAVPGSVLASNVSASTNLMAITGFTSMSGCNVADAPVKFGGFLGITRMAICYSAAGTSVSLNGGVVKSGSPITVSGAIKLLQGNAGTVRRIQVWNGRMSDAQLQAASAVAGKTFSAATDLLVIPSAAQSFFDDFLASSLRTRSGDPTVSPLAYNNHDMVVQYETSHNWMPRFAFQVVSAKGSDFNSINGEWELYCDPQYPGMYNPFDWGAADASVLGIKANKTVNLTSGQQALIGNRYAWGVDTGVQWPIVSGCLTTANKFAQKFGYFEARIKIPTASKMWPAFWMLPDSLSSEAELDILEAIGITGDPGFDTGAIHYNSYGVNDGITRDEPYDLGGDYHTYGALWQAGKVTWYRDGKKIGEKVTGGNFDNSPMYLLLNLAVGGNWPGDPDSATYAALPCTMKVDYVRAFTI
jgi:beta-glucanase (GH16 family)